ncbi:MAG TPA: homocysteine S-methyltransferase family protein [Candidatus Scybalocola faecavium]|nr:homocysteine S-methyltransferase family protein [Candidatus Scybalocola faecavium]
MKKTLDSLLKEKIVILDGATGTNLQKMGMPSDVCPEKWIIEHPEAIQSLQRAYVDAGCDMVYAPTFSANSIKLREYGLENQVEEINQRLVRLSREAVGDDILVAGDMTMTGQQLKPMGDLTFDDLMACYEEQAKAIAQAGVDVFIVETMMNLQETRAAVLAIKKVCSIPVMVTMTFDANGHTLYGTDGVTALIALQALGIEAFGMNCSSGPENMGAMLEKMVPYARIPLIVKPNAGLPEYVDGKTVFSMGPEDFARESAVLLRKGALMAGGCCGTTPEHIRCLAHIAGQISFEKAADNYKIKSDNAVTTQRKSWFLPEDLDEKIKTGAVRVNRMLNARENDDWYEDLCQGQWDVFYDIMEDIADDEPDLIQICVDGEGIDGVHVMAELFDELDMSIAPVAIVSENLETLESALIHYPGKALVWDCSRDAVEKSRVKKLCEEYGARVLDV